MIDIKMMIKQRKLRWFGHDQAGSKLESPGEKESRKAWEHLEERVEEGEERNVEGLELTSYSSRAGIRRFGGTLFIANALGLHRA